MCPASRCPSRRRDCSFATNFLYFGKLLRKLVAKNHNFYPVILAGGRGTRFWPLSRKRRSKQLLALDGKQTMIQQTVGRLLPMASSKRFWIITNEDLQREIGRQLPKLNKRQIVAE